MVEKGGLAYYVTAHGYGHGVRSCDIIRALNALRPELPVTIVSDLAVSFFKNRLDSPVNSFRGGSFDVGMVQLDSIRVDVRATLLETEALCGRRRKLIDQEASFLDKRRIAGIVVDIPALPLEAATKVGIPRLAVGNFAWDWIYSAYQDDEPRWRPIVDVFRKGYSKADLLLRLPFSEPMASFPQIEDIPIVASPGKCRRSEIAALTRCRTDCQWILICFTTLVWNDGALDSVEKIREYEFFTVRPLVWGRSNMHAIDREQMRFSDVIATVDAVISKPGFGIISECVVNRKPLLYVERSDFPEFHVLEKAIQDYLKFSRISGPEFYRGELRQAIEDLWVAPKPLLSPPIGGAKIAAERIWQLLSES